MAARRVTRSRVGDPSILRLMIAAIIGAIFILCSLAIERVTGDKKTAVLREHPPEMVVRGSFVPSTPAHQVDKTRYLIVALFSLLAVNSAATAAERLRFWNLTGFTIKELHLAPTGTTDWGPDQCKNDPDGAVDADERLTLKNVVPGHYDVKLVDKKGRICVVRNVEVQAGKPYAFSISEKDLTDCSQ